MRFNLPHGAKVPTEVLIAVHNKIAAMSAESGISTADITVTVKKLQSPGDVKSPEQENDGSKAVQDEQVEERPIGSPLYEDLTNVIMEPEDESETVGNIEQAGPDGIVLEEDQVENHRSDVDLSTDAIVEHKPETVANVQEAGPDGIALEGDQVENHRSDVDLSTDAIVEHKPRPVANHANIEEKGPDNIALEEGQVESHSDVDLSTDAIIEHKPGPVANVDEAGPSTSTRSRSGKGKPSPKRRTRKKPKPKCNVCKEAFATRKDLLKHRKTCSPESRSSMTCSSCDALFRKEYLYIRHLQSSCASATICDICRLDLEDNAALLEHIAAEHSSNNPCQCSECGRIFRQPANLRSHIQSVHRQIRPVLCGICGCSFSRESALKLHAKIHVQQSLLSAYEMAYEELNGKGASQKLTPAPTRIYSCIVCQKSYQKVFDWFYHMMSYESTPEDVPVQVEQVWEKLLKDHKEAFESVAKPCEFCDKVFFRESVFRQHLESHKQQPRQRGRKGSVMGRDNFECAQCHCTFRSAGGLGTHQRLHNKSQEIPCPVCGEIFSHSFSLNKHKLKVHNIGHQDLAQCHICDKVFQKARLKKHIVDVHNKVKRFSCNECDKSFATKYSMQVHITSLHRKDNKQHVCPSCERKFSDRSNLLAHCRRKHPDMNLRTSVPQDPKIKAFLTDMSSNTEPMETSDSFGQAEDSIMIVVSSTEVIFANQME